MPFIEPDFERQKIDYGLTAEDLGPRLDPATTKAALRDLGLPWPPGLAPQPKAITPEPDRTSPLPNAHVLVVTWTVAEVEALADVLTPGIGRNSWYRYAHKFESDYLEKDLIRDGAPAHVAKRLGSYYLTEIAGKSLLLFKSELHLNQDGKRKAPGKATLPVADLLRQIIKEVEPSLVITVGTAGATFPPTGQAAIGGKNWEPHGLGDVMITRGAKFRLSQEFANEAFAHAEYTSNQNLPTSRLDFAATLLEKNAKKLEEPAFGPPSTKYPRGQEALVDGHENKPKLRLDGRDFPAFHPILTTDFFEFGTSTNNLQLQGCGVEMGDAVLGMVVKELRDAKEHAPDWLVIRNASDPQINGSLPDGQQADPAMRRALNMQAHWAVWYYETYGYWTSVNSAIAVWAMVA
ncbi:hypothetical protein A0O30_19620 [Pseudomonas sp. LLC-1]|uniref:hypothetical protein n=1 Tax=Pseudomonas sp. LLC-1 TaxID=1812180 RepID=UPI000D019DF7|nr:hypothetical protein [Pseudomonas sp. LLC-1]PRN02987.1 hypothetical protein A0O30_19620 [Pseudomonas sp. LLC-1]